MPIPLGSRQFTTPSAFRRTCPKVGIRQGAMALKVGMMIGSVMLDMLVPVYGDLEPLFEKKGHRKVHTKKEKV